MATLTGTVKDEQGGVLPGATISVVNAGTSAMREATTTGEGNFVLPLLQPGTYTVTVRMEGFAPVELRDVILDVGERRSLALTLSVGSVGETVVVQAGASVIQADSGAIGNSRYEAQIKSLPVVVREVQSLIGLTAGVPQGSTSTVGGGFARGFRSGVQVLADGVQVNPMQTEAWPAIDGIGRRADLNIPGIDTLTEVKVVTNGANAEYAQPTQAIIASKSGTNTFTGSLFEFYRSGNMAARRWEAPAKESFNRHQFGGTAGGPLVRDEMFYFVGFEGFRHKATNSYNARYPTDAERNGDLSALLNRTSASGALAPITIYDPLTGQPFPGNIIPASRISPVARELLTMIPSVSGTGSTLTAFNASYTKPLYDYSEKYDARVDLNLGSRNRFFGKATIGHLDQFSRFAGDVPGDYGFSTKNEWTQTVLGNFTRSISDTHAAGAAGVVSQHAVHQHSVGRRERLLRADQRRQSRAAVRRSARDRDRHQRPRHQPAVRSPAVQRQLGLQHQHRSECDEDDGQSHDEGGDDVLAGLQDARARVAAVRPLHHRVRLQQSAIDHVRDRRRVCRFPARISVDDRRDDRPGRRLLREAQHLVLRAGRLAARLEAVAVSRRALRQLRLLHRGERLVRRTPTTIAAW